MKPIQVGLLGIGTVGSGVFNVLQRNQEEIRRRAGRGIEVVAVSRRDQAKAREIVGDAARWSLTRATSSAIPISTSSSS